MEHSDYNTRLEQDRAEHQRRIHLMRTSGQTCLFLALATLCYSVWLILSDSMTIDVLDPSSLAIPVLLFLVVVILLIVCSMAYNLVDLWSRDLKQNQLRFDVHSAVDDVLREILGKHIPGYKSGITDLNVADELLRETEFQTKRRADIARRLVTLYQSEDLNLAEAVNRFIAQSLAAHSIKAEREAIEKVLRDIESTSVVPFTQRE